MVEVSKNAQAQQDRAAFIAALGFPVLVLIGGGLGFSFTDVAAAIAPSVTPLLGMVMFAMALTLRPVDFALVAKRPLPVLIGVVAQFVIMPLLALLVVTLLDLPAEITVGVILVGCAPGGTTSNVVAYLSRGDVALSVCMTSISTILAPFITPFLTLWLAGAYMEIDAASMMWDIVLMVLIPVIGGLVFRTLLPRFVDKILPILPWISVVAISTIVGIVVGGARDSIAIAGALVLAAVALHNGLGYLLGYITGLVFKQPVPVRRTIAVEVGMQNSGLATALATTHLNPLAALPGALFSIWHCLSGAVLAAGCRYVDRKAAERASSSTAEQGEELPTA
ncbi:Putative Na+-dependent transporter [Corynebacterium camporealensis]|uniref:Putative Na+-dependent transporter n=1 Tax=Corynebacterium camporealensis TaxID=161896 RepID=A0A0F6QVT1_9CORY|nr:bile acid:sodium symporter family protein [Corynebacterium camporealensis]AKE39007.1 putative Na+-dependent transporter [Corynebacterium camporealensis]AVH88243.1 Putative Na+-dependent transporter [Corynebacterium camporealensis]